MEEGSYRPGRCTGPGAPSFLDVLVHFLHGLIFFLFTSDLLFLLESYMLKQILYVENAISLVRFNIYGLLYI